jgi:hypothetical protein
VQGFAIGLGELARNEIEDVRPEMLGIQLPRFAGVDQPVLGVDHPRRDWDPAHERPEESLGISRQLGHPPNLSDPCAGRNQSHQKSRVP